MDSNDITDFIKLTGITVNTAGSPDTIGIRFDESKIEYLDAGVEGRPDNYDERTRVCVIGVEYTVDMAYEGITPVKSVFEFIWDSQVDGWSGNRPDYGVHAWEDEIKAMEGGGYSAANTSTSELQVPGKLIYYVVR